MPAGFVEVRHYGLLSNRGRAEQLAVCRALLAWAAVAWLVLGVAAREEAEAKGRCCPACGAAAWEVVAELPKLAAGSGAGTSAAPAPDTS